MQFDNGAYCKGHIHMVVRMIPCKFEVRMHENEIIVNSHTHYDHNASPFASMVHDATRGALWLNYLMMVYQFQGHTPATTTTAAASHINSQYYYCYSI